MTYHLHTQDCADLPDLVRRYFPDFTLTHATGYWQDSSEPAAVIKVVSEDRAKVFKLAADIREINRQSAVLVETIPTSSALVTARNPTPPADLLKPDDPVADWLDREIDL